MNNIEKASSTPNFEKKIGNNGNLFYSFDHVGVAIDNSGKNQKDLPEILFGTFDSKPEINNEALSQPAMTRPGVDMEYIVKCIEEVAKDSGIHEFWLYPYSDDSPEDKEKREDARLRLFRRYTSIEKSETGYGYVLKI